MLLTRLLALTMVAATLTGCIGIQPRSDGVFEPTAMQPPPSAREAGARSVEVESVPVEAVPARTRTLSVPAR